MEPESAVHQFVLRRLFAPPLIHDAIQRGHEPRAIRPMLAVDQYRAIAIHVVQRLERGDHVFVADIPRIDPDTLQRYARSSEQIFIRMKRTKAHDLADAQRAQLRQVARRNLRAAIKRRRDAMQVIDVREDHRFGPVQRPFDCRVLRLRRCKRACSNRCDSTRSDSHTHTIEQPAEDSTHRRFHPMPYHAVSIQRTAHTQPRSSSSSRSERMRSNVCATRHDADQSVQGHKQDSGRTKESLR